MQKEDYERFFYERLYQLRNQKSVSARDMSLSLGQNENYINSIENKRNFPSMAGFFYICEYLDIHPKDFFDSEMSNPHLSKELHSKLSQLKDSEMEHLIAIIDDLVS